MVFKPVCSLYFRSSNLTVLGAPLAIQPYLGSLKEGPLSPMLGVHEPLCAYIIFGALHPHLFRDFPPISLSFGLVVLLKYMVLESQFAHQVSPVCVGSFGDVTCCMPLPEFAVVWGKRRSIWRKLFTPTFGIHKPVCADINSGTLNLVPSACSKSCIPYLFYLHCTKISSRHMHAANQASY